jgi:hypothetical protein
MSLNASTLWFNKNMTWKDVHHQQNKRNFDVTKCSLMHWKETLWHNFIYLFIDLNIKTHTLKHNIYLHLQITSIPTQK